MRIDALVRRLLERGDVPGLTLLVGRRGRVLHRTVAGQLALEPAPEPLPGDAIYDLASLTKPLLTALLAASRLERGELDLRRPVDHYFANPVWPARVEELLTHTAGLPPWHPFYLFPEPFAAQLRRLQPGATRPGRRVVYSCVGYMLLKELLERTSGASFRLLAESEVLRPLRLADACLAPVATAKLARTAPTERGNVHERGMCREAHAAAAAAYPWRAEVIRGQVHDVNSHHSGGCAGNAGLFATAADLLRLAMEFYPATATRLKAETLRLFWEPRVGRPAHRRSVGFRLNAPRSGGGRALSDRAIGHSGFTGVSLWLEPDETVWIVLANRVHPRVRPQAFDAVRRRLHAALRLEVGPARTP